MIYGEVTRRPSGLVADNRCDELDDENEQIAHNSSSKTANEFSSWIRKLSAAGVATLMATHDLLRAKGTATRVGIMKQGMLAAALRTEDIGHADLEPIYLEVMS